MARMTAAKRAELQRSLGASVRGGPNSETFNKFSQLWSLAQDDGLKASAVVARDMVRAKLSRGYTTGEDVTGAAARAVRAGSPVTSRSTGNRYVRVYAKDFKQVFWEFGWFWTRNRRQAPGVKRNLRRTWAKSGFGTGGTARFFRVSHWSAAAREAGPAMATAFHRAFHAALNR